jgi:hypothetical protein
MPLRFSEAMKLLEDGAGAESENYRFMMQCYPEYRRKMLKLFVNECRRKGGNISDTVAYVREVYGIPAAEDAELYYRELLKEKGVKDAGN